MYRRYQGKELNQVGKRLSFVQASLAHAYISGIQRIDHLLANDEVTQVHVLLTESLQMMLGDYTGELAQQVMSLILCGSLPGIIQIQCWLYAPVDDQIGALLGKYSLIDSLCSRDIVLFEAVAARHLPLKITICRFGRCKELYEDVRTPPTAST